MKMAELRKCCPGAPVLVQGLHSTSRHEWKLSEFLQSKASLAHFKSGSIERPFSRKLFVNLPESLAIWNFPFVKSFAEQPLPISSFPFTGPYVRWISFNSEFMKLCILYEITEERDSFPHSRLVSTALHSAL